MKTKFTIIGLLAAGLFAVLLSGSLAESDGASKARRREVVILRGFENYFHQDLGNREYLSGMDGYSVMNSSSSSGAPQFPPPVWLSRYTNGNSTSTITNQLISLAEAMAQLFSEGYQLQSSQRSNEQYGEGYTTYLFVK